MQGTPVDLIFGWAALLSAAVTMATLITGVLFFTVNESFGTVNDAVSVLQVVLMLPVAIVVYLLTRPVNGVLALLALAVGGAGMGIVAVLQAMLVLKMVRFEQTIKAVLSAGAAIGAWLVLSNLLALLGSVLPWGLALFGIGAGIGYLLAAFGFYQGGQQHLLFYAGSALIVVGYVIWGAWLGRLLQIGMA
jgi:hypothetical protein